MQIAVWGLGRHATRNILPAIASLPRARLYGVCSRNTETVAAACRKYGCVGWNEAQGPLDDPNVDVIYLSTPIGLHAAQAESVLRAGKHLWCEKPLAGSPDEVQHLLGLSRMGHLTLAEAFMYLHHPQFEELQRILASGRLGGVHTITCRFGIPPMEHPGFRLTAELGGGAFLDVAVYPISAMVTLLPNDEPEVRFAEILTAPGSPVDTGGRALLGYANGCSATLEWRTGVAYRNEIDFWGTTGSLSTDRIFSKPADYVPTLRLLDAHGRPRYHSVSPADHFLRMLSEFQRLIEDPDLAERERQTILRRARLLRAVEDHSSGRSDRGGGLETRDAG